MSQLSFYLEDCAHQKGETSQGNCLPLLSLISVAILELNFQYLSMKKKEAARVESDMGGALNWTVRNEQVGGPTEATFQQRTKPGEGAAM